MEKLKKIEPRYKNKLRVKDKKNIIRSVNTYIKYESVKYIYVSFDGSVYQLFIFFDKDSSYQLFDKDDSKVLAYDKSIAIKRRQKTREILIVLNKEIKQIVSSDVYLNILNLIKSYDNLGFSSFFDCDGAEIIMEIESYINSSTYYIHNTGKKIYSKVTLAKKVYSILFNRINHANSFRNKLDGLKNKISKKEKPKEKIIDAQIEYSLERLNYIYSYNKHLDDIEHTYREIIEPQNELDRINLAIENIDNPIYMGEYEGWDYESLIAERQYFKDTNEIDSLNYMYYFNLIKGYHNEFEEVEELYEDYITFNKYLKDKNIPFSKRNLEKVVDELIIDMKKLSKFNGRRRKFFIRDLEDKYQFDFKSYYRVCIDEKYGKFLFIYRLLKLNESKSELNKYIIIDKNSFSNIIEEKVKSVVGETYTEIIYELNEIMKTVSKERDEHIDIYYDIDLSKPYYEEILYGYENDKEIIDFIIEDSTDSDLIFNTNHQIDSYEFNIVEEDERIEFEDKEINDYSDYNFIMSLYYGYVEYFPTYSNPKIVNEEENNNSDLPIDNYIESFYFYNDDNIEKEYIEFFIDYEPTEYLDKNFINYTEELEIINKLIKECTRMLEVKDKELEQVERKIEKFDEEIRSLDMTWVFFNKIRDNTDFSSYNTNLYNARVGMR